eukprot:Opistho-1_new@32010
MRIGRRLGALVSGGILYSVVIGLSAELAEQRPLSAAYAVLGGRNSFNAVLGEASLIAVVVFVLALLWCYLTVRSLRLGRGSAAAWCVAGLGLAWFGWMMWGATDFALHPKTNNLPISTLLLSSLTPPLWGVLNIFAALAGALIAGAWVRRAFPRPVRRRRGSDRLQTA